MIFYMYNVDVHVYVQFLPGIMTRDLRDVVDAMVIFITGCVVVTTSGTPSEGRDANPVTNVGTSVVLPAMQIYVQFLILIYKKQTNCVCTCYPVKIN